MAYFTYPKLLLNWENFLKIEKCFGKKPDLTSINEHLTKLWPKKQIVFTNFGRTAFQIILDKFDLKGNHIMLPAYICDTFLPILKEYKIKPIFLDANSKTFNLDPLQIKAKKERDIAAILICHTYGLACDMEMIQKIVKSEMLLIEDCSHSFGLKINTQFAGNFGDIAFLSLAKRFAMPDGGILICPKTWNVELEQDTFTKQNFLKLLNLFPQFSALAKKLSIKQEAQSLIKPSSLSDVSLNLFNLALKSFASETAKRIPMALFLKTRLEKFGFVGQPSQDNIFTFLSVLVPKNIANKRDEIVNNLAKQKIFCGKMWHNPIILNVEAQQLYKINLADFPVATDIAKRIINIPLQNFYTEQQIDYLIACIAKAAGLKT